MSVALPSNSDLHVVVGARGQIGAQLVRVLETEGQRVRKVTQRGVNDPATDQLVGDIADLRDAERLCAGAKVVYACFGGAQSSWAEQFPRMTRGIIHGARLAGARLVYADNLYAYGPQLEVLSESTVLKPAPGKSQLRADIAAQFLAEHERGGLPVAIARASDLYGPGVLNAMVNAEFVARALEGRTLRLPGDLNAPHTFTFVHDVARALARLGMADDGWGQVWHVPSAPAVSLSSLVARIGELGASHPRVARVPEAVLRTLALFKRDVRELLEMAFQWDRPYLVSHTKFQTQYGLEPTSLERGLRITCSWVKAGCPSLSQR